MFFLIHLNPRVPEGPANMLFFRDLLLEVKYQDLAVTAQKNVFIKHFVTWINPLMWPGMLILSILLSTEVARKIFIKTVLKKWTRMNVLGKERRCVVFIPDQVKPHVLKLETKSFGTELATTIVHVNDTLDDGDVCHNACLEERFVIAVHPAEE